MDFPIADADGRQDLTASSPTDPPTHTLAWPGLVRPVSTSNLVAPAFDAFVLIDHRLAGGDEVEVLPFGDRRQQPALELGGSRQAHRVHVFRQTVDDVLASGEPAKDFAQIVAALTHRVEVEHMALFASHMVIGEAYVALQHHYAVAKRDAKAALRSVLTSGLVAPWGGDPVLDALATNRGCGLLDRLIALQYSADDLTTLTLDRKMPALTNVTRLTAKPASR